MHLTGGDAGVRYEKSENTFASTRGKGKANLNCTGNTSGPRIGDCDDDAIAMHTWQRLPTRRVLRESLSKVSICEQSDGEAIIGLNVPVRSPVARSMHDVLACAKRGHWRGKGSRLLPFLRLQGVLHIPISRFTCQLFLVRVSRPRFRWHNRLKYDRLRCDGKGWCEEVWDSVCANMY